MFNYIFKEKKKLSHLVVFSLINFPVGFLVAWFHLNVLVGMPIIFFFTRLNMISFFHVKDDCNYHCMKFFGSVPFFAMMSGALSTGSTTEKQVIVYLAASLMCSGFEWILKLIKMAYKSDAY